MRRGIKRYQEENEYFFEENCFINELSNSEDDPAVSIARARVKPGETTKRHHLESTEERYVILEGTGRVETGDHPATEVGAGDVVLIPAMTRQRISNTGEKDLVFLAICSPRFNDRAYRSD